MYIGPIESPLIVSYLTSSKVKGHGANPKLIGVFLYDLHCVQHYTSHGSDDVLIL